MCGSVLLAGQEHDHSAAAEDQHSGPEDQVAAVAGLGRIAVVLVFAAGVVIVIIVIVVVIVVVIISTKGNKYA